MKVETLFDWSEDTGVATCIITNKNGQTFYGYATCHPKDQDMKSEKTGCTIALRRAYIKTLCHYRDNECKQTLKTLFKFN